MHIEEGDLSDNEDLWSVIENLSGIFKSTNRYNSLFWELRNKKIHANIFVTGCWRLMTLVAT